MIKIINSSIEAFKKNIEKKDLLLFGAGKRAAYVCETYNIGENVKMIIDNNKEKIGTSVFWNNIQIPIISVDDFVKYVKKRGTDNIIIMITPAYYILSIVEQLDRIKELDNLECYIGRLLEDYYENQKIEFTKGKNKIPKKIHYCWFGEKKIPHHLQKYINGWKEKCPEYEIIRWNESNYDLSKNQYMKQAYENKKWGFVPDYARLDIIYNEGGIYLDTDVELITSLDKLLNDSMFCGFNGYGMINLGLGFGAEKGNELIRELRDEYDGKKFCNEDGSINLTSCTWYQYPVLKKYGVKFNNTYQNINGNAIYPSEVLAPLGTSGCANNYTSNTISCHHAELSWVNSEEKGEYERFRKTIMKRILSYK